MKWIRNTIVPLLAFQMAIVNCTKSELPNAPAALKTEPLATVEAEEPLPAPVFKSEIKIRRNSTVYEALTENEFQPQDVFAIVNAAREHTDLSRIRPGTAIELIYSDEAMSTPVAADFKLTARNTLKVSAVVEGTKNIWTATFERKPINIEIRTYTGDVVSSLWGSADAAGMDSSVIISMADIFAWQIDFAREVRDGDSWRIVVEEQFVGNKHYGWGNILIAEYKNVGEVYTGIRFPIDSPDAEYYAPDGTNLRKMFLKSPIKFARISSKFNRRRFHPILKRKVPHNGVDYAARPGTRVMTVGDGKIVKATYNRTAGNYVRIRHNSVYETAYCHLKGFAKSMKRGKKVKQGQVVGYVGQTGLATGPHLHFAFYERGRFVDPLGKKFPNAAPVPSSQMAAFRSTSQASIALLGDLNESQTELAEAEKVPNNQTH